MSESFEPRILAFLCNWCSYAGADLAGVSRFQYPTNIRVVRTMCSGRVDPTFILRAFWRGIDGVLVLGCHLGDCHYSTGNYHTQRRMREVKKLLGVVGLNPNRLRLDWVSAAEGERFARLVAEFTQQVRELGPPGSSEGLEENPLRERLLAAYHTVQSDQIRWLIGRELELVEGASVYGEKVPQQQFDALMEENLAHEYLQNRVLLLCSGHPLSVREIARRAQMSPREVLRHVVTLEQEGRIAMVGIEGNSPQYQRVKQ